VFNMPVLVRGMQGKKHGIFDHEEVDLSELMDDSQASKGASSVKAGMATKAPPPGECENTIPRGRLII
jgi:hypothetical protein